MLKKLTALLLALVLCVGIASIAMAAKGPFETTFLTDDADEGLSFSELTSTSSHRALTTWFAHLDLILNDISIEDIDLSKPSYVGVNESTGALDIFLPTSDGYLNACFGKDGTFTVDELSYTSSQVESKYPHCKLNSLSDLMETGEAVKELLEGL